MKANTREARKKERKKKSSQISNRANAPEKGYIPKTFKDLFRSIYCFRILSSRPFGSGERHI